jgi:hypothetical protein
MERLTIAHRLSFLAWFLKQVEKLLSAGQNVLGARAADMCFPRVIVHVRKV